MTQAHEPAPLLHDLLGPLHMHFLCARAAYADYMASGKSFLFAQSLRRTNGSARELLIHKGYLLPEPLQQHAVALIRHYDAWITLWDELAARAQPQPHDPFVFQNEVTYPKDAELALERHYEELVS